MSTMKHLPSSMVLRSLGLPLGALILLASAGCATVRPEQRAILADPTMRFDAESPGRAALERVLDNREGSTGGGSVRGGGCGCN
jgi:hypothetical protein